MQRKSVFYLVLLFLISSCFFFFPSSSQAGISLPQTGKESTPSFEEHVHPKASDQQTQEAFRLPHKASLKAIDKWFENSLENIDFIASRFSYQLSGVPQIPATINQIVSTIESQNGDGFFLRLMVLALVVIVVPLLLEFLLRHVTKDIRTKYTSSTKDHPLLRIQQVALTIIFETTFLALYGYTSIFTYYLLLPNAGPAHLLTSNLIMVVYLVRLIIFLALLLLSPKREELRIIPMANWSATYLFRWIIFAAFPVCLLARFGILINKMGYEKAIFSSIIGIVILTTYLFFVVSILLSKKRVRAAIEKAEQSIAGEHSPLVFRAAHLWHLSSLILVTILVAIWEIRFLSTGKVYFGKVLFSSLVAIFFVAIDYWGQRLFQFTFSKKIYAPTQEKTEETGQQKVGEQQATHFLPDRSLLDASYLRLRIAYRLLLLALCVFFLFSVWDVHFVTAQVFTLGALLVITVLVISYLLWHLFKLWIDTRISDEIPDQEEFDEGGKGGSRKGTLLLLLRKAVLATLFVFTVMSLLAALGINIVPLIAGAGIIGLAISFGAQSLIADIFAGLFFLIDDAFRVGDYVDCGGTMGTVEHISLRSLRLRHHRGMVHTIPFGKISSVTNFSRDYIIMKLDFRVRYDTDVDKVRKLIKRIYKELESDAEFGPKLIGKLKSQGVREMDDSAMIMRVKFTTRPGDQFELRKEVYRRVQESFQQNNIAFAHRNVTVYMPPEEQSTPGAVETKTPSDKARGAAAAAMVQAAEEEQLKAVLPKK